jgi:pimeloyl-ACP methyl ester carboxylesterase
MTADGSPESKWVEANGLRLHYVDWGGAGPPMLLTHGLQDCCRLWDGFARDMRSRYRVLSLDHRGHGDSPRAASYPLDDYVRELGDVIEALDLRGLVLMGHSAGAKNAFIHTALHPERIARLIIVDMDPDAANSPGSAEMVARYKTESDDYPDLDAVVERLRTRQPRTLQEALRHHAAVMTKPAPNGGLTWKRDRDVVLKYDRPEAWQYLPRISVPTLILRTLLTGPVARRMQQQIRGSRLVEIPDAAHWVHLEQPQAFLRAVTDFLESPDPPRE